MQPLLVTIDGPAGTGKSTVARLLAKRLGVEFLDTGAMYRGLTAYLLDRGVDLRADRPQVSRLVAEADLKFDWRCDPPHFYLNNRDMTPRLRDPDVTAGVSDIASMTEVRQKLVAAQRQIGLEHPRLVTEGRDQGSVVFPDAHVKFYLDAVPKVRARRRALQLGQRGEAIDEEHLLKNIIERDQRDAQRPDGPLIHPPNAERIDTTDLDLDEVVNLLEARVRRSAGVALEPGAEAREESSPEPGSPPGAGAGARSAF